MRCMFIYLPGKEAIAGLYKAGQVYCDTNGTRTNYEIA